VNPESPDLQENRVFQARSVRKVRKANRGRPVCRVILVLLDPRVIKGILGNPVRKGFRESRVPKGR